MQRNLVEKEQRHKGTERKSVSGEQHRKVSSGEIRVQDKSEQDIRIYCHEKAWRGFSLLSRNQIRSSKS